MYSCSLINDNMSLGKKGRLKGKKGGVNEREEGEKE